MVGPRRAHSPGPWTVVGRTSGYVRYLGLRGPKGDLLVGNQLDPKGVSIAEAEANAALAAAAPDLLDALQGLIEAGSYEETLAAMDVARGVVAKAVRP